MFKYFVFQNKSGQFDTQIWNVSIQLSDKRWNRHFPKFTLLFVCFVLFFQLCTIILSMKQADFINMKMFLLAVAVFSGDQSIIAFLYQYALNVFIYFILFFSFWTKHCVFILLNSICHTICRPPRPLATNTVRPLQTSNVKNRNLTTLASFKMGKHLRKSVNIWQIQIMTLNTNLSRSLNLTINFSC